MDIEEIRNYCLSLKGVTEDIKWGSDLCFSVGGKMFCVTNTEKPLAISFKVPDEEFDEISNSIGFIPAPYLARHKWVLLEDENKLKPKQLKSFITKSYELVKAKLPKKTIKELKLNEE